MMFNHSTSGNHYVEDHVKVYVVWDDHQGRWVIDPIVDPEFGELEGLADPGQRGQQCDCPRTDSLPGLGYDAVPEVERLAREGHEATLDRAARAALPDARELLVMLADYLGCYVVH